MNILIGLNMFQLLTGSETYTYYLAKGLLKRGHSVDIYARSGYGKPLVDGKLNVQYWDAKSMLTNNKQYDVMNLMHPRPIMAMLEKYPNVPAIATHHGIMDGERITQPSQFQKLIVVSEEVKHHAITHSGVLPEQIEVVPNFIDLDVYPHRIIEKPPFRFLWAGRVTAYTAKALRAAMEITDKVSARLTVLVDKIEKVKAPKNYPIEVYERRPITSDYLSRFGLVFGSGRFALEAIATGIPVVIVGREGSDGIVRENLLSRFMYSNFSGRTYPTVYSNELYNRLAKRIEYMFKSSALYQNINKEYEHIRKLFDSEIHISKIESIYEKAIEMKSH